MYWLTCDDTVENKTWCMGYVQYCRFVFEDLNLLNSLFDKTLDNIWTESFFPYENEVILFVAQIMVVVYVIFIYIRQRKQKTIILVISKTIVSSATLCYQVQKRYAWVTLQLLTRWLWVMTGLGHICEQASNGELGFCRLFSISWQDVLCCCTHGSLDAS